MDLNMESAYEPYSHQGRFHEAEHRSGDKLFAAISDQQLLLKRKKADQGTQRTIEGLRLVLRVIELLLDLSTLALMLHAAIVWWTTRNKIVDNGSGWRVIQWPHTDMRPTWTMMGVAVGTTLAHVVSLITQCRKVCWGVLETIIYATKPCSVPFHARRRVAYASSLRQIDIHHGCLVCCAGLLQDVQRKCQKDAPLGPLVLDLQCPR